MTAGRRRARPPADFPPDAADAEPLKVAWRRHADPAMLREFDRLNAWLMRIYRRHSDPHQVDDRSEHVRGEFRADPHQLQAKALSLFQQVTADFLRKLLDGDLAAWARSGSPLAPAKEVPANVAKVLRIRLEDLGPCTAFGPHVALFDLHVGRRKTVRPAAEPVAQPAARMQHSPGPPRSVSQTLSEPVPEFSASALRAWFLLRCRTWSATRPRRVRRMTWPLRSRTSGSPFRATSSARSGENWRAAEWRKPGPRRRRD